MALFHFPHTLKVGDLPVIVYPDEDVSRADLLSRVDPDSIKSHVESLYGCDAAQVLKQRQRLFDTAVLWNNEGYLMTDVRQVTGSENWGSGGNTNIITFRRLRPGFFIQDIGCGTGAEFGDIVYGAEATYRLFGGAPDKEHPHGTELKLEEFLAQRPALHPGITNNRPYHIQKC